MKTPNTFPISREDTKPRSGEEQKALRASAPLRETCLCLVLWACAALALPCAAAPVRQFDFEQQEHLDQWRAATTGDNETALTREPARSGGQVLRIRPNPVGALRSSFALPKDFQKGWISFWFFDPVFAEGPNGSSGSTGWTLYGARRDGGKDKQGSFEFATNRGEPFWGLRLDGVKSVSPLARRAGWMKFDLVFDPSSGDGAAVVYANGQEVLRVPGLVPRTLAFVNIWGSNDIFLDDFQVNDDPAAFHPSAVQEIATGNTANEAVLKPGESLTLDLTLNPRAAAAPSGTLEIELQDLQEKSAKRIEVPVDWAAVKDSRFRVPMPAPSDSGHYWVFASYRDAGTTGEPARTLGKIDVQFLADPQAAAFRGRVRLPRAWEWVPGEDAAASPTDWKDARKMRDLWHSDSDSSLKDVTVGCYRQAFVPPAEWAGKRVRLRIDQPQKAARVYLNGKSAGEVVWPGGFLDVTEYVRPGERTEVVLVVDSRGSCELIAPIVAALGKDVKQLEQFNGKARGLGGDVTFLAEPKGAVIGQVTITPHVGSEKRLDLGLEFQRLESGKSYTVEGSLSQGGKVAKTFSSTAFSAGSPAPTITVSWPGARVWDLGKPNRYDLNLQLKAGGKAVDATWPERFGFREVAFDGRLVKINGNPVNLFMPMPTRLMGNYGFVSAMQRNNMNFVSATHHHFYDWPGESATVLMDSLYSVCDEAGIGTDLNIAHVRLRKFLVNFYASSGGSLMNDKLYWDSFERVVRWGIGRYGNHPSIFFLLGGGTGGNLEMGNMMNPMKMDGKWLKKFADRPVMRDLLEVERRAQNLVHRIDPRKPICGQDGGNFNDAMHVTHYAGFMPMQEFIEWNSYWRDWGTKPYFIGEQSAPFAIDWTTGARMGHGSPSRYSAVAERVAETKGDVGFHRQPIDQEELTQFEKRREDIVRRDPASKSTLIPPLGPLYAYQRNPGQPSGFADINYERAREQWLNWRADGLGLLCYWNSSGMDGIRRAIDEAWAPLTGFLAGPSWKRTDKTHILRPGEVWNRQFLVLNNRRDTAKVECVWSATIDGREIASGSKNAEVTAGGQASIPIPVTMPAENADKSGVLTATLRENGRDIATDKTEFLVLARKEVPAPAAKVAVIDPLGDSVAALRQAGVRFDRVNFNENLAPYDVIIFGKKAFDYESAVMPEPVDLAALLDEGKRILVLEQGETALRDRFGFRTEDVSPREMFGRVGGHPVLDGLPDQALRYWRGEATLTDGRAEARSQSMEPEMNGARRFVMGNDGKEHPRQMKWGNTHNVTTVMLHKPDRGNYRTLIDTGYGLDYASVLELEQGGGRLVFCQADVSGRSEAEPAAERVLDNLVAYLAKPSSAPRKSGVAYLGGAKGADLLEKLQTTFHKIASPAEARADEILVLGDDLTPATLNSWKTAIAQFVQAGGTVLSLPRAAGEWDWLPFPVSVKETLVDSSIVDKPVQPLLAGLSNSELYYQGRIPVTAIEKVPAGAFLLDGGILADVPYGKGRYVFSQVSPDSFDVNARFYLEFSRKHSYRMLQTLLNNLGAPTTEPHFLETARGVAPATATRPPLDLVTATWEGIKAPAGDEKAPAPDDPRWRPVKVPGYVNDQRPEWNDTKGFVFWYRCRFRVAELPPPDTLPSKLHIGAIDDEDDIWMNGKHIGHTGRDTNMNDWLLAPRYYPLAPGVLREGMNELLIRVVNFEGRCGIPSGPARILWGGVPKAATEESLIALASTPVLNLTDPGWKVHPATPEQTKPPLPTEAGWTMKNILGGASLTDKPETGVWCQKEFKIPALPAGARPVLTVPYIDDEDEVWINGKKIGETNRKTNPKDYYSVPRAYPIPPGVLKTGSNMIDIRVHNVQGSAKVGSPMRIHWLPPGEAEKIRLSKSPYLFEVDRTTDPYWWTGGW